MKPENYFVTPEQMKRVLKGETVCLVPGKEGVSIRMNPDGSFEYIPKPTHTYNCNHVGIEFSTKDKLAICEQRLAKCVALLRAIEADRDDCVGNYFREEARELLKEVENG